ncbi:H-NS histone (plasmid) [Burkholderia sp. THE68]|uniref:H-NS histone family protein n=1 Tax=Burkholderia sp. THE68 TaxID=758782 RepID=UPI001317E584|nr:H-NS histone family protein [Burkholderia sp. THE68]BBU33407.1 H-NS histone [Burkholderia sp. THE68]
MATREESRIEKMEGELVALEAKQATLAEEIRAKAIALTQAIMEAHGLTAEDVGLASAQRGRPAKKKALWVVKKTAAVAAKYRDPKTGTTWSGRGREPFWIKGKKRDRFLIAD